MHYLRGRGLGRPADSAARISSRDRRGLAPEPPGCQGRRPLHQRSLSLISRRAARTRRFIETPSPGARLRKRKGFPSLACGI